MASYRIEVLINSLQAIFDVAHASLEDLTLAIALHASKARLIASEEEYKYYCNQISLIIISDGRT